MKAEDILPDDRNSTERNGTTVRKGSVGAFLANARILRDPAAAPDDQQQARTDLLELVPALTALGMWEVFSLRDPVLRALVEEGPA